MLGGVSLFGWRCVGRGGCEGLGVGGLHEVIAVGGGSVRWLQIVGAVKGPPLHCCF